MTTIEAVYEHGVFKPLHIPPFGEGQHVLIIAKISEKQKESPSFPIVTLSAEETIERKPQKRIFGVDAGKGWISEEFNAPLLKEFE